MATEPERVAAAEGAPAALALVAAADDVAGVVVLLLGHAPVLVEANPGVAVLAGTAVDVLAAAGRQRLARADDAVGHLEGLQHGLRRA